MSKLASKADSPTVTSSAGSDDDRGAAIQRRIDALGISDREWHITTGIDRKTLHRAIRNEPGTRSATYTAIESWLDKLEAKVSGEPVADVVPAVDKPAGFIRITVEGVYGANALIVEAPPENIAELEAMVDRIMRRLADPEGNPPQR